jgi:hypothetical protein
MFRPNFNRKHVSLSENAGIIVLSSAGISFREISAALDVSKSAVPYRHQWFRESGELKRKSGTGGKPKLIREVKCIFPYLFVSLFCLSHRETADFVRWYIPVKCKHNSNVYWNASIHNSNSKGSERLLSPNNFLSQRQKQSSLDQKFTFCNF